jgi:predicted GNAT family N-acyltransferase
MKTGSAWADVSGELQLHSALRDAANGIDHAYGPLPARTPCSTVHGSIQPADVRPGDPVSARARLATARDRDALPVQVWRLSPLGVELVRAGPIAEAGAGDRIDVVLQIGHDRARFSALEVAAVHEERGRALVAARWADADELKGDRARRRVGARWRCQPEYLPTGIAPSAVRFADYVHFRVAEISRHGMQLLTSLRNKFLVPGTTLDATCSFPTLEQVKITFRVVQARVVEDGGKPALSLGVTWEAQGARAAETIGQYVLQFGPGATPDQLRTEGLPVRSTSRAFDFGNVQGEADYREVLALRRLAYVDAGKISSDAIEASMGDAFDRQSRIITARYRGLLVGTIRVMFPRNESDRLKHEDYCELPASLPPRTEIVEMSKACTHPEFRGSDLFYSIIKHGALAAIQSRRRYILMSCTDQLYPIYKKLGFKDLGISYVHAGMGLKHYVMLGEIAAMVAGRMNPILWNVALGPEMWAFAKLCGAVPPSPWRDLRVRLLPMFKPLVFLARMQARRLRARSARP